MHIPLKSPGAVGITLSLMLAVLGCGQETVPPLDVVYETDGAHEAGLLQALGAAFLAEHGVPIRWHPQPTVAGARPPTRHDVALRVLGRDEAAASGGTPVWVERHVVVGPALERTTYGERNYRSSGRQLSVLGPGRALPRPPVAADLMKAMRGSGMLFVSRGDGSRTHQLELGLWGEKGPPRDRGYLETHGDMAVTLRAASAQAEKVQAAGERRAPLPPYTLTDEATFLRIRSELHLHVILASDPTLESVVVASAAVTFATPRAAGTRFVPWLASDAARDLIRAFEVDGERPFSPAGEAPTWTLFGRLDPESGDTDRAGQDPD